MNEYDTDQLIRHLANTSAPMHRLPRPWLRAVIWSGIAVLYLAALYAAWPTARTALPSDARFVVEQTAAFLTGTTAAIAAFATVVPGYPRRVLIAPIGPLAVWLGIVSGRCVHEWSGASQLLGILAHGACLPATLIAAVPPAVVIVAMLRRGAPITPHLTTALAALAAAGLGNFGIRFVHATDAGVVVLVWHLLAVFLLSLGLAAMGNRLVNWRHTLVASGAGSAGR